MSTTDAATRTANGTTARLYIVSRTKAELYQRLSTYFAPDESVAVIVDRRHGDRRGPDTGGPGRRHHDVSADLETRGWAFVEVERALDDVHGSAPGATASLTAIIEGATPQATAALSGHRYIIDHFPYAIERCGDVGGGAALVLDRRLALPDREPYRVSRRHCVLVRDEEGFWVVDATSRLGTVVNGVRIGGSSWRRRAALRPGVNDIAIGGSRSPYVFRLALTAAGA